MTQRFRNTRSGELEAFEPLEPGHVRIYSCGPTVYAPLHVGNFRAFLFDDLLVRYLRFSGYEVTWVMNVTDIDDKIIAAAQREGTTIEALAGRYRDMFLEDARTLRMTTPDVLPSATEHIPEMVDLIERLLDNGHAYRADDGSIFFRISSWPGYGALAHLDPAAQKVGARVLADEYGKDDVRDFALWKGPKPGEPSWDTAIGPGRPGWHIECSAMSMKYLGQSFDIHTGGVDLIFPHHEDEIAQSEAATGKPFVRTWLHNEHLRMAGRKMAKREGNFSTTSEILDMGYAPRALRYALLAGHYREPLEFSEEPLRAAASAVERLSENLAALDRYSEERPDDPELADLLAGARTAFVAALDDDLNAAAAFAAVFELVRELNRRLAARTLSTADARRAAALIRELDTVMDVAEEEDWAPLSTEVLALLERRDAARREHDWETSDRLREELAAAGLAVEDTSDGQRWRRLKERARG
jgi:cysteinyl-tRNA synthetase